MTLENIYYIGQTVAVTVILATLIAILIQGYQTNKIARADLTLSMWMQTGQMHNSLIDNPEKAEFMHRALISEEPLSEAENMRLAFCLQVAFGTYEAAFNLRNRGLVEAAAYEQNKSTTSWYLHSSRVRKWWHKNRTYGADSIFRNHVDVMADEFEAAEAAPATAQGNST